MVLDAATGTLVERAFESGLRSWRFVEVKSGLSKGDRIVLSLDREGVAVGAKAVAAGGGAQP
jgi:HlyD family secretion protein